jgi:hypothetical protein
MDINKPFKQYRVLLHCLGVHFNGYDSMGFQDSFAVGDQRTAVVAKQAQCSILNPRLTGVGERETVTPQFVTSIRMLENGVHNPHLAP